MTSAIPFAGLAPDTRVLRAAGDLAAFDVPDAWRIGHDLRRVAMGGASTAELGSALLDALNAYDHDARPACVLLRAYVTRRLDALPPELRALATDSSPALATAPGDAPVLQLIATRGVESDWNDERASRSHRVLSLLAVGRSPMVAALARQLRFDEPNAPPAATFHVADPVDNPALPDKELVTAYGVRSVLGFCVRPWQGETLVVILFSRAAVERSALSAFETLGLYTKLAWLGTGEAGGALSEEARERARAAVLDQIVEEHEAHLDATSREGRRALQTAREEAQKMAEAEAERLAAHNLTLRRTQRAMLNLVEDLREARADLQLRVEQRTEELAAANATLAARNRDLEEFAYIASHDLQEPLRTVAGYLQMIERRYRAKLGPEGDEFIRFAVEGAQRMQALIESLLLYSRVASAAKARAPVALEDALDLALRNLALRIESTGATVERTVLPVLPADRTQMVQLFQNLLSNAIKFAGDRPPRIHISATIAGGVCTLGFRDEGIGFNPRYADRIFKIFRRLRRDTAGTGIGLAICKKIVESHGGRIEAQSQPGQGATFFVHLPVNVTPQSQTDEGAP